MNDRAQSNGSIVAAWSSFNSITKCTPRTVVQDEAKIINLFKHKRVENNEK